MRVLRHIQAAGADWVGRCMRIPFYLGKMAELVGGSKDSDPAGEDGLGLSTARSIRAITRESDRPWRLCSVLSCPDGSETA